MCKPVFSNTSLAGQIQSLWQTACVLHEIEQNETSSPHNIQLAPWTFLFRFVPASGPEITNYFIQSYSQLIPYPLHHLCFAFHSSLCNGPLFNELKSCFQRSNTVFSTHVPSSTKTNSSGFEERRVDSVEEKKEDWWKERWCDCWAVRFGRQGGLVFYSSCVLCIHHSDRITVSRNLILQSLAKVN